MTNSHLPHAERAQTQKKYANLFFLFAMLFGMVLLILKPPFVTPDENVHYLNICHISHGNLFADVKDGEAGFTLSAEEYRLFCDYGGYYNGTGNENRYSFDTARALFGRAASKEMVFYPSQYATMNPTAYLPAGLIVGLLGLIFPLNGFTVLCLARVVNLCFFAFVMRLALQKTAALPKTMFLLSLMPMTVFQGASASYDAILIPCCFLLFAYATRLLATDASITVWDIAALLFACACIFGVKVAYAPLVLILLSLGVKRFGSKRKFFTCAGCTVAVGALFYLLPSVVNAVLCRDVVTVSTQASIEHFAYVKSHWYLLPWVLLRTTVHHLAVWAEAFVGKLGWLDTRFPVVFIVLFLLFLLFVAATEICDTRGVKKSTRILSFLGFCIFYVGTLFVMYIEFNPVEGGVGSTLALGIQGRYFIPAIPFLFLACANTKLERVGARENIELWRNRLIVPVVAVSLCLTAIVLLLRYWF